MKLEQQVTSLEISKRLKELGVKQESQFVWVEAGHRMASGYGATSIDRTEEKVIWLGGYFNTGEKTDISFLHGHHERGIELPEYASDNHLGIPLEATCSAYLSDEIAEMLPQEIKGDELTYDLNIWKKDDKWFVSYWWNEDTRRLSNESFSANTNDKNLVEALAKMAIYLKEQGII